MSRLKIKKLSTGVKKFALYSVKVCTPYKERKLQDSKLKKEKRKKDFPALKAGKGSTPGTTMYPQPFFVVSRKFRNGIKTGVGLAFVEKLLCKKKVAIFWPVFYFVRLLCCK